MRGKFITGIDLGSSSIYVAVGRRNEENQIEVIGTSHVPTSGVKEGMVVNIENTIVSISKAIREAEVASDTPIKEVYVGIKGHHIESFTHESAILISRTDKEITSEDVSRVMDNARVVKIPSEKTIIHVMPQGYTVDSQKGVENPIGMEGTHLIANVQIIYGMMTAINNVVKCINRSGLGCPEVVLGIYAASEVVITKEEKDLGCVLIDIGGQTVNLAIFYDGYLRYIKQLPIGGDFITRDIARVERILPSEAKRIKETHGSAEAKMIIEDQVITALGMDNIANIKISERKLAEIIEARMREILTFAKDEIRNTEHAGLISSGAILIGGGAILNGAKDLAEQVFGMPVHIGVPHNVIGIDAVSESPLYGTAIGLIKFVEDKAEMPAKIKIGKGILAKLKAFIDQLF